MMRWSKILAALCIGAIGLLFFLDNLFNLQTAHSVVSLIVSGAEQPYYKMFGPAVTIAPLTWAALFTIMAGELLVGLLGLTGAWKMFSRRNASAEEFNQAKHFAILGGFLGMFVWFGFFITIGESYFNMWQTETGLGSVEGALRYGVVCALMMFYIRGED